MPEIPSAVIRANLRQRRTVHDFQRELPPWATVRAALDSARFAPNHYFTQPWRFYRIGPQTQSAIIDLNTQLVAASKGEKVAEKKRERWGEIPGWLVVTSQKTRDPLRQKEDYAATCCAVQNLMLELWSHGIGCKWTTGAVTRHADFYRILGCKPHQEDVVALLWYGYPAKVPKAQRSPLSSRLRQLP